MKIIASLPAGALLLAGINMAAAQALPTNPPAPQEGGGKSALVHRMGADGTATQSNAVPRAPSHCAWLLLVPRILHRPDACPSHAWSI